MIDTPEYEWDDEKNKLNQRRHGLSFDAARKFEWDTCSEFEDNRYDYGEDRMIAIGFIENTLCTMAFTYRGERVRVISLRRSTAFERKLYNA